jgi:hypothetical protein
MSDPGHGSVGKREQSFTAILPLRANSYDPQALAKLAQDMKAAVDTVKDGPDPEENILVPAGYTYLGQFIDHDLTFDSTSSLDPSSIAEPTNLRSPRFDLDCLYGDGPDAQPFMYDPAGEKLLFKDDPVDPSAKPTDFAARDLLRNPNGRAIIGDKRNDENSIVSQIQLSFVKFHNAVVDELKKRDPTTWNTPNNLFVSARNEVRWTHQRLLVEDFLPRIVRADVLENLKGKSPGVRAKNYALYTEDKRSNLPREFVAAAYRFGHSGVRTGYRLNADLANRFDIFPASNDPTTTAGADSLLGFDPITNNQVIDNWGRFFPNTLPGVLPTEDRTAPAGDTPDGTIRLQFAYKIDPTLVDPLGVLPRVEVAGEGTAQAAAAAIAPSTLPDTVVSPPRPSLALLNLLRGNSYRIQSGQAVARALQDKGFPCTTLEDKHLATRQPVQGKDGHFKFVPIASELQQETPLWFYILAEAQAPLVDHFGDAEFDEVELLNGIGAQAQLGWVGGRIVAEVFYGLLDSDDESYVNAAPEGWKPMLGDDSAPVIFRSLLKYADPGNS